jgi:hypothetical protein
MEPGCPVGLSGQRLGADPARELVHMSKTMGRYEAQVALVMMLCPVP